MTEENKVTYTFYTFTFKMPIETGGVLGSLMPEDETRVRLEEQLKEQVGEFEITEFRAMTEEEVAEIAADEMLDSILSADDDSRPTLQ